MSALCLYEEGHILHFHLVRWLAFSITRALMAACVQNNHKRMKSPPSKISSRGVSCSCYFAVDRFLRFN